MITLLKNSNEEWSNQIYTIFQNSYKIEAQLIEILDFPPLMRSVNDITDSKTKFYGYSENSCLAAVIEVKMENKLLEIHSLTVDPPYFRRGIAGKLIGYILGNFDFKEAVVETAAVNTPAINLYKKHGFVEFKQWTPSHGIEKVALSIKSVIK